MSKETKKSKPKTETKAAKTESPKGSGVKPKEKSGSKITPSKASSAIQNGKGSAPRNMGPQYLSNFDTIKWESSKKKKRAEGQKTVKV
ncbi:MAG: hypothetical protein AAFY98_10885, partial [Verrucomicrobiota bacterium]